MKKIAFLLVLSAFGCTYDTEEDEPDATVQWTPGVPCSQADLVSQTFTFRGPMCFYRAADKDHLCAYETEATLSDVRAAARKVANTPYVTATTEVRCTRAGAVLEVPSDGAECDPNAGELLASDERPPTTTCVYHVTATETHDPLGTGGCNAFGGHTGDPLQ